MEKQEEMSAIFHQAVLEGDTMKVKFILKYGQGIRVNQPNKYGLTALQQACISGNLSLANFLLERGADLKIVDSDGRSSLHLASERGHLEVVSLLINSTCVDVNARDNSGRKAVDVAKNDQVRALLSQAMLSESFKQRCGVADGSGYDKFEFKNVPGWRNSISSTSTDSGVSEDSFSQDSGSDSRNSSRYHKPPTNNTSDINRQQRATRGEFIYARRVEPVAKLATVMKSNSFTGSRHESGEKLENASLGYIEEEDAERSYRRRNRNRRDPSRRKTVTFGESEAYYISDSSNEEQRYTKSHSLSRGSNRNSPPDEGWGTSSKANATLLPQESGSNLLRDRRGYSSPRGENMTRNTRSEFSSRYVL